MVTTLAVHDSDYFKNEPVDGPTFRPQSLAELDVREAVLEDLALKILYLSGTLSISELAEKTRLSFEVMKELATQLRAELLCQVVEGPREDVERLIQSLRQGPGSARVDSVDVVEQPARGDLPPMAVSA